LEIALLEVLDNKTHKHTQYYFYSWLYWDFTLTSVSLEDLSLLFRMLKPPVQGGSFTQKKK